MSQKNAFKLAPKKARFKQTENLIQNIFACVLYVLFTTGEFSETYIHALQDQTKNLTVCVPIIVLFASNLIFVSLCLINVIIVMTF